MCIVQRVKTARVQVGLVARHPRPVIVGGVVHSTSLVRDPPGFVSLGDQWRALNHLAIQESVAWRRVDAKVLVAVEVARIHDQVPVL